MQHPDVAAGDPGRGRRSDRLRGPGGGPAAPSRPADQARVRDRARERELDATFGPGSPAPYLAKTLPRQGAAPRRTTTAIGAREPRQLHRDDQRAGAEPATRRPTAHVFSDFVARHDRRRRAGARPGLRVPAVGQTIADQLDGEGPDAGRATWRTWATTRARAGDLRPPGARRAGRHAVGHARRPVRGAARPVRLLPLDHRRAGVRRSTSSRSTRSRPTSRSAATTPNSLHHAQPLRRRPRRAVRRRAPGRPRERRRVPAARGCRSITALAGVQATAACS